MYCGECGAESYEQNNYCVDCGAKLASASRSKDQRSVKDDADALDAIQNIRDQITSINKYQKQLVFIRNAQNASSEVGAAVNECISILKQTVIPARKITEYHKSNRDSSENFTYTESNENIGEQVQNYLTNRSRMKRKIDEYNQLVADIRQLSPNPSFSESKKHYTKWVDDFENFVGVSEKILEGMDRGLETDNERVVIDIGSLAAAYLQGDDVFEKSIQDIERTANRLENTSSKLEQSLRQDYKNAKEYV